METFLQLGNAGKSYAHTRLGALSTSADHKLAELINRNNLRMLPMGTPMNLSPLVVDSHCGRTEENRWNVNTSINWKVSLKLNN